MIFENTLLPGVVKILPKIHKDARGYFMESWQAKNFAEAGIGARFVQENVSGSSKLTLRGLHYQVKRPQGKLVRVVHGEVFDVAVDLRRSSPVFGQWIGVLLSAENKYQLWVPPGFGHGFLVLSESAEFEYKCTDYYCPEYERAISWSDPDIGIEWPLPTGCQPVLSEKDATAPTLRQADTFS